MPSDGDFPSGVIGKVKLEQAKSQFLETVSLIERLQNKHHEVIAQVLEEKDIDDLTSVQAILIYNLGDQEIMAGEMKSRGIYLGSNVSYNLKKLVSLGYLSQRPAPHDKRAVQVSLTDKGKEVRAMISRVYTNHIQKILATCPVDFQDIISVHNVLQVIDQFWAQELYLGAKK